MKKYWSILLGAVMSLSCLSSLTSVTALAGAQPAESAPAEYNADFSAGLPADWILNEKSDAAYAVAEKSASTSTLTVEHTKTSSGASTYYGALYNVATSLGNIGDFTLELTYKTLTAQNNNRWLGVMYHTQTNGSGMLSGYMMNMRVGGRTAQSTVTAAPSFNDYSDKQWEVNTSTAYTTLKITMKDTVATHYINGEQVLSYDVESMESHLLGANYGGGFAIIVNQSKVEISSLTITGHTSALGYVPADTVVADTYGVKSNLVNPPTVVKRVNSAADIDDCTRAERPSNVILSLNSALDVLDENGEVIDTLDNVVQTIKGKTVPVLEINSAATAREVVQYLKSTNLLDVAVISKDSDNLAYVKDNYKKARVIFDASKWANICKADWQNTVAHANKLGANIIVLDSQKATYDAIAYMQARFKSVWTDIGEFDAFEATLAVAAGTYGIISNSPAEVYNLYTELTGENVLNHAAFNVAHRGLCLSTYENSVTGAIQAAESGATHVEIDLMVTKDDQLVLMHDDTIDRTTNGKGKVAEMTLAEIQQYKVIKSYSGNTVGEGEKVPSAKEYFDAMKDKDIVTIIEIKDNHEKHVEILKKTIQENNLTTENFVVICFYPEQLQKMKELLPEIPTALLATFQESSLASHVGTLASLNAVADGANSGATPELAQEFTSRGFGSWFWTYSSEEDAYLAYKQGIVGITTNEADKAAKTYTSLTVKEPIVVNSFDDVADLDFAAVFENGAGETANAEYTVVAANDYGTHAKVILQASVQTGGVTEYTLYSVPVVVFYQKHYLSVDRINEILNKDIGKWTDQDKSDFKKIENVYLLLREEQRTDIDFQQYRGVVHELNRDKVAEFLMQYGWGVVGILIFAFAILYGILLNVLTKKASKKKAAKKAAKQAKKAAKKKK